MLGGGLYFLLFLEVTSTARCPLASSAWRLRRRSGPPPWRPRSLVGNADKPSSFCLPIVRGTNGNGCLGTGEGTVKGFFADEALSHGASIAYYTLFALAPRC